MAARRPSLAGKHEAVSELYGSDPALRARAADFWPDELLTFDELHVLAERAGLLTGDAEPAELAEALVAAAVADVPPPPLGSESEEDKATLLRRLELLA